MRVFDVLATCAGLMKPVTLLSLSKQLKLQGFLAKSSFFANLAAFITGRKSFWNIEPIIYDAYISGLLLYVAARYVGKGSATIVSNLNKFNSSIALYKQRNNNSSASMMKVPLDTSIEIIQLYQAILTDFLTITGLQLSQPLDLLLKYVDSNSLSFGSNTLSPSGHYNIPISSTLLNIQKLQSDSQLLSLLKNRPTISHANSHIYDKGPVAAFINDSDGSMFLSFVNPP